MADLVTPARSAPAPGAAPAPRSAPAPDTGRQEGAVPAPAECPGATLTVRHHATGGVTVSVSDAPGRNDAAVLRRLLNAELDAGRPVIVVNLIGCGSRDRAVHEVLAAACERARGLGTALHVVDPGKHAGPNRLLLVEEVGQVTAGQPRLDG